VPRLKNEWSFTSTLQYALMAWCSAETQGQLYLLPFTNESRQKEVNEGIKEKRKE